MTARLGLNSATSFSDGSSNPQQAHFQDVPIGFPSAYLPCDCTGSDAAKLQAFRALFRHSAFRILQPRIFPVVWPARGFVDMRGPAIRQQRRTASERIPPPDAPTHSVSSGLRELAPKLIDSGRLLGTFRTLWGPGRGHHKMLSWGQGRRPSKQDVAHHDLREITPSAVCHTESGCGPRSHLFQHIPADSSPRIPSKLSNNIQNP